MKKLISLIICLCLLLATLVACTPDGYTHTYVGGICTDCGEADPNYKAPTGGYTPPCAHRYVNGACSECSATDPTYVAPSNKASNNHLLTDADGNYGGAINRSKYGMGAPLNGQYDVENTIYYTVNDFYNMKSTNDRTIYTGFRGYQQQMQYTSGLASIVAALNYWEDSSNATTELRLLEMYEELNNVDVVAEKGTTVQGLANLWTELGYTATVGNYVEPSGTRQEKVGAFRVWVEQQLSAGKMIFVRGQDNMDNRWKLIIGYDNMGTDDWATDDVVIFADPYDGYDHNQDGYTISGAGRFERWWRDISLRGEDTNKGEYLLVTPKTPVTITRVPASQDATQIAPQSVPELHLLLNPDGSYGGTRDEDKYGAGTPLNGKYNHLDRNYHKFVDVYNLTSTDTLTVLTGYRAFSQTHASTCGICSTLSVLAYYGEDVTVYDELWLNNKYEELTGSTIKSKGVGNSGLKQVVSAAPLSYPGVTIGGYRGVSHANGYSGDDKIPFPTYESFVSFLVGKLSKGTPLPISHRPHGGHWEVLIGYDDMGTSEYIYDDIIILADSGDSWDHYQDGYNVYSASLFYRQWYNGSFTYNQQYVVFDKKA